jgi:single-stranded-DNA-specific exonuclease
MVKESNLNEKRKLNSTDIGFNLAPKLNAAGRIGCAQLVVDLLITNRMDQAREIALFLSDQNKQRQKIERQILTEAKELAESEEFLHDPFLVLAGTTWHPGIVGVVAGRLTEEFGKPCIVLAPPVTSSTTSDTSTEDEPLAECESLVVRAGGHAAAAGLQIEKDKIPLLRQKLCQLVKEKYPTGIKPAKLILDAEVPLSALTHSLVKELDQLEPYGMGNKKPIYLATNLTVEKEPTLVGTDGLHLRFQVSQAGVKLWAIAFRMGKRKEELMSNGGAISLAFTPKLNEWNGFTSVSLEVVDFQPLQNPDLE